jgi:hypothetical protein
VATSKSPNRQPVPTKWVQKAIDMLESKGEVTIDVATLGYRSAFIGAARIRSRRRVGRTFREGSTS